MGINFLLLPIFFMATNCFGIDTNICAAIGVLVEPLSFAVVFPTHKVALAVFLAIAITCAKNKMSMMVTEVMEMAVMVATLTKKKMVMMLKTTFAKTTWKLRWAAAAIRRLASRRLFKIYKWYNDISILCQWNPSLDFDDENDKRNCKHVRIQKEKFTWTSSRPRDVQNSLILSHQGCRAVKQSATIVIRELLLPEGEEGALGIASTSSSASLARSLHRTLRTREIVDRRKLHICHEAVWNTSLSHYWGTCEQVTLILFENLLLDKLGQIQVSLLQDLQWESDWQGIKLVEAICNILLFKKLVFTFGATSEILTKLPPHIWISGVTPEMEC